MSHHMLESAGGLGRCSRCGEPCKVANTRNAGARLLRFAEKPVGLCANCAVTQWFVLHEEMMQIGDLPGALLIKPVQEQFARVMASGKADMRPNEINWAKVVEHWDLPWPKRAGGRRR